MTQSLSDPLPAGSVLLHVGPPKTGSTAVQGAFRQAKSDLEVIGVRCPGKERRAKTPLADLLRGDGRGSWARFTAAVGRRAADRVWVSNEDFAAVPAQVAARAVDDLGGDRVEVVYVVRPIDKLLPSQWQQRVRRSRSAPTYDDWLREVLADEATSAHTHFWSRHDLAGQSAKWSGGDPRRMRFVVSREGDYDYLLHVFEDLLAIPRGTLVAEKGANSSLTLSGAELLRELDRLIADVGVDDVLYRTELKPAISKLMRDRPVDAADERIELPGWAVGRVEALNQRRADFLERSGHPLIGDPRSLVERAVRSRSEGTAPEPRISSHAAAELLAWALAEGFGAAAAPTVDELQHPGTD